MIGIVLVFVAAVCCSHGLLTNEKRSSSGMLCRSCKDLTRPRDCTSWERCGLDEECFARSYLDANGRTAYRLGCEQKAICRLATSSLFGRRSSDGASCFECCQHSDGCNTGLCHRTQTTDFTKHVYPTGTNRWYWTSRPQSTPFWFQYKTTPYWHQYTTTFRPWSTANWYTSTNRPWSTHDWHTSTMRPWSTPDWYQYFTTKLPYQEKP